MTAVRKLDGSPGAGKTYTLKERLREEKRDGIGASDFWWLTFTRAGRDDVQDELPELFAEMNSDEMRDRARTLHSLALSLVIRRELLDPDPDADGPGPIITPGGSKGDEIDPYSAFCDVRGMRYDPDAADPRKLLSGEKATDYVGNKLFAINDFLRQTCKPPEQWRDAGIDINIAGDRVEALLNQWDAYKRETFEYRLFEHGDYVDLCYQAGLTPDVDVLLIDEFQDFAPIEYRLFKQWRDNGQLERIYIAGDPNQAIYSFRGGTPHYFEHTDTDAVTDLKDSYRCPAEIAAVGNAVLSSHTDTDPRGFQGREGGGQVEWSSATDRGDIHDAVIDSAERHADAETPVMLLTRTNSQLRQLTNDLRRVGIPFEVLGTYGGVWRGELQQMLTVLNRMKSGDGPYSSKNVNHLLKYLPNGQDRRRRLGRGLGDTLALDAVEPVFEDFDTPVAMVDDLQIDNWKRDVLKNAVDAPASLDAKEVKVGTVHTSKGLESPSVYLFTTSSKRTIRQYARDSDKAAEEHRIYYVGATRASSELHLVSEYFDGPTAPPVQKVRNLGVVA
jgi:superfamily I DNA/RNA helicase